MSPKANIAIEVLLPLPLKQTFTYLVPPDLESCITFGCRVEAPFGKNKMYAGIIVGKTNIPVDNQKHKYIYAVLDQEPVITRKQYEFWQWMAAYYMCTVGEVMNAALPSGLKMSSETYVIASPGIDRLMEVLDDREYMLAEALSLQPALTIDSIRQILGLKVVYPVLKSMIDKGAILLQEEMKSKYKPKTARYVRFKPPYHEKEVFLNQAFDMVSKSKLQTDLLLALFDLNRTGNEVSKKELLDKADSSDAVLKSLVKKDIVEIYELEISRLGNYSDTLEGQHTLSDQQTEAMSRIDELQKEKDVVLLYGVTGSGKTRVYTELIKKAIARGEQVLYLLPEIALTSHFIHKLQKIFGDDIRTYHSKLSVAERVEMWHLTMQGQPVILGPRSAMFLPFRNLSLIVIDEEHDPSYKQKDPAPRYQGRDSAIKLATMFDAKTILGSATPSIESYMNAESGKYGLVKLTERHNNAALPKITLVDLKEASDKKKMKASFTETLIDKMTEAISRNKQIILFQNRRGFAPILSCKNCDWTSRCINCDISLTYHKFKHTLKCHLCNYQTQPQRICPSCGSTDLDLKGIGTERIEDELGIYFEHATIQRFDYDTVSSKGSAEDIITAFSKGEVQIMVGTQMLTKGLDFDNVGLVGIINADQLFRFPDFKATERAFQMLVQVSGRAGRRSGDGEVFIQTYHPENKTLQDIIANDDRAFYAREIEERKTFRHPPFTKFIHLQLRHKDEQVVEQTADFVAGKLRSKLGQRVLGPADALIKRQRNLYHKDIYLRLERSLTHIESAKSFLQECIIEALSTNGMKSVRFVLDVDP